MYRVIIVDDEEIMREGLIGLVDWKGMGFEIVGQFEDGEEAIHYLDKNPVDVLLTDIKMTFVSGIDLAKYIHERKMCTKIVFISGYREFEYARQAVQYDVVQYLLKPISLKDIYSVFKEIGRKLDEEKKSEKARENRKKKYDELLFCTRQQFFTDLVFGALQSPDEICRRWNMLDFDLDPGNCPCCIWTVCIRDYEKYISERWDFGRDAFYTAIQNVLCIGKDAVYLQITANHKERFQIFIGATNGFSQNHFRQLTAKHIDSAADHAEKLLGIQLVTETEQYFDHLFAVPQNHLSICLESPVQREWTDGEQMLDQQKLLMVHLRDGNEDLVRNLADQMLKRMTPLGIPLSKRIIRNFFIKIASNMERNKISLPKIWEKDSIADSINRLGSCDELRSFVHSRLSDCLWLSGKNRDQSDSIVIQHIKEYIRDHYDRDLTLDDISDQVFLNPIYISRLFKKETGENFSDYLIRVRMENAVKLLQEPHYRVYEVGNKVGYHSTKYFYRIFKRFYGCTPTEYRKTLS